jgi:hypothetical protein
VKAARWASIDGDGEGGVPGRHSSTGKQNDTAVWSGPALNRAIHPIRATRDRDPDGTLPAVTDWPADQPRGLAPVI